MPDSIEFDTDGSETGETDFGELANSPLQRLQSPLLRQAEIQLYVKRDDLIHAEFGGNKWRKLKYNLQSARQHHYSTLLTFGGAWSNHIYATAAAGKYFGFNTIGIIRGERHTPLNPTLQFAEKCGMQCHYISREQYRQKAQPSYLEELQQQFGPVYVLPEGGSNALAVDGCSEIVAEVNLSLTKPFDTICCASGTGATLAGIISACSKDQTAIGFSALKGGQFLNEEVKHFLSGAEQNSNWHIEDRFHFGGYAKINDELLQFMKDFHARHGIELDAVYTGKMFYGLFQLIKEKYFEPGSCIVAIHSGGLQGNRGFDL